MIIHPVGTGVLQNGLFKPEHVSYLTAQQLVTTNKLLMKTNLVIEFFMNHALSTQGNHKVYSAYP